MIRDILANIETQRSIVADKQIEFFAEIFGCDAVYLWLRLQKPAWWWLPDALALALFAWLLTLHPQVGAGRVYAAASQVWLWAVEGLRTDRWDLLGSVLCLVGTAVILFGPRS